MVGGVGLGARLHLAGDFLSLGTPQKKAPPKPPPKNSPRRPRYARHARTLAHGEAEAEGITRYAEQQFAGCDRRRDARTEMIGGHQCDAAAAQHAVTVELAAIEQHLREAQIVRCGGYAAGAAGVVGR